MTNEENEKRLMNEAKGFIVQHRDTPDKRILAVSHIVASYDLMLKAKDDDQAQNWKPIVELDLERPKKQVLVTNNLESRTNSGQMSNSWLVGMVHKESDEYFAYKDNYGRIRFITHFCEIPN